MLIAGLILTIGSIAAVMGLYAWAVRDWLADSHKPLSSRRPVRYVAPRYLLMGGVGALLGLVSIAASQAR